MTLMSRELGVVQRLVYDRAAIVLGDEQGYLVESRLTPLAREFGCGDLGELVARISREPHGQLQERVVEAMTTNETSFFRDRHPFNALKDTILPELLLKRNAARKLRIWSGACSSGQEAYSLLMQLHESFPLARNWDIKVIGTDLSKKMVERGRAGCYSQIEIGRGLPAPLLVKYFERAGAEWRVREELRKRTEWYQANLTRLSVQLTDFDIVFLRNVLIYFDTDTRAQVLAAVVRAMRPDGYLFLGSTETTHGMNTRLEPMMLGKTTVYRLSGAQK